MSFRISDRLRVPAARFCPALLIVAAICYYGSYYRSGFEPADEGSVALLSQRLLQGERPFTDVALGYNVLWFYPIVGLFTVAGVNFVAMKAYFCCLAGITALLGFSLVRTLTRSTWFGFVVGLVLIACPGSLYKTYIPLIIVGNSWVLARFLMRGRRWRDAAAGGLVLGLSFLIRIDLGILLLAVWVGVAVAGPLLLEETWRAAFARLGRASMAMLAGVLVAHLPFVAVAKAQGFLYDFACQYSVAYYIISQPVISTLRRATASTPQVIVARPLAAFLLQVSASADLDERPIEPDAVPAENPSVQQSGIRRTTLQRVPFQTLWTGVTPREQGLALLTYAPAAVACLYGLFCLARLIRETASGQHAPEPVLGLALTGAAFCAFPQFFFFRPDIAHLSEFLPGFIVSGAVGCSFLFQWSRSSCRLGRLAACAVAILLVVTIASGVCYLLVFPGGGTFNVRLGKKSFFRGDNGVRVYLKKREAQAYREIKEVVQNYSSPRDYVVCYPYAPGINLFTNRPTFERSLYVDDALVPERWQDETVRKIVEKQPAVIVLNDWAINGTEESKFSNWATRVKKYVTANYHFQGDFRHFEVYTRLRTPLAQAATRGPDPPQK